MIEDKIALVATNAALKAGELLRRGFGSDFKYSSKESANDYVTEYDYAAEGLIIEHIRATFKDHSILAEESGELNKGASPFTWVIDPIDGTTNFLRNIPLFCISIGITKNKIPIVGVIYQPMTHELFVAVKGQGSYLNGKKITVSTQNDLNQCTLVTGFPYSLER
ncbi:inositol monophosphatase, partial [Chlamydiales bacterium]|nr:inositol monophosphatase [Chlamydiales bacterium]